MTTVTRHFGANAPHLATLPDVFSTDHPGPGRAFTRPTGGGALCQIGGNTRSGRTGEHVQRHRINDLIEIVYSVAACSQFMTVACAHLKLVVWCLVVIFSYIGELIMTTDIDVDKLISLVQERPQLWDRTLEEYKDRNKTRQNWIVVCSTLHPDYDELSDIEKKHYCQLILKRWNNIRDQWMKWKKKEKDSKKSGVGASKLRKYIYHEALQFLEKVRVHAETTSNIQGEGQQDDTVDESGVDSQNTQQTTITVSNTVNKPSNVVPKKKKKMDDFELRMLKVVETSQQDGDRHLSFFKGIIPSISKFSEPQIVEFQLGVLQLV
ncbi:uncharacterized protein LOC126749250 [Anthonomus grandis grandis]|uniref:uncharacterized protein LOC126749250 n=1 Tax=Anthonomus grandis grandis TaxID=2921223 RepID=UPI0021663748|nr:uncharacterized protein LOC126749250 [Anthonomus grandis grandis]